MGKRGLVGVFEDRFLVLLPVDCLANGKCVPLKADSNKIIWVRQILKFVLDYLKVLFPRAK